MLPRKMFSLLLSTIVISMFLSSSAYAQINVISTFSDYASIAKEIGGDKVKTEYLSHGAQDPHFVAPKPSLAMKLKKADMFICSGMDLEMWATTLLDKARNKNIMDGAVGFVAVNPGIDILEKPQGAISRTEGDIHVSGNPHFQTSPASWVAISENIIIGLKKVDPENAAYYEERQKAFVDKVYRRLFGDELVDLLGGERLTEFLLSGTLFDVLEKEYQGEKLVTKLGGWMKMALPFRNKEMVAYHKNWSYFARDFGLTIIGFIEPKPGIPPTPKHVQDTINSIKEHGVDVMLVASYFEKRKPNTIAQKTGIKAVFLPISVDAIPELSDNFKLVDFWIDTVNDAVNTSKVSARVSQ
ncbi:metal ABC transporter substrate-binding protein [Candidatus Latescibacterota bacterium]